MVIPDYIAPTDGELGGTVTRIGIKTSSGISWLSWDEIDFSNSEMVIPSAVPSAHYVIYYSPKIKRVTAGTAENTEIPIPDDIASLIPYYVKGELYREEDASEADNAKAWFTAGLNEIVNRSIIPTGVSTVYGGLI